ncbi:hypothetical protein ACQY0O_001677 [Thecaphora frezii]
MTLDPVALYHVPSVVRPRPPSSSPSSATIQSDRSQSRRPRGTSRPLESASKTPARDVNSRPPSPTEETHSSFPPVPPAHSEKPLQLPEPISRGGDDGASTSTPAKPPQPTANVIDLISDDDDDDVVFSHSHYSASSRIRKNMKHSRSTKAGAKRRSSFSNSKKQKKPRVGASHNDDLTAIHSNIPLVPTNGAGSNRSMPKLAQETGVNSLNKAEITPDGDGDDDDDGNDDKEDNKYEDRGVRAKHRIRRERFTKEEDLVLLQCLKELVAANMTIFPARLPERNNSSVRSRILILVKSIMTDIGGTSRNAE